MRKGLNPNHVIVGLLVLVVLEAALLVKFWPRPRQVTRPSRAAMPAMPVKGKIAIVLDDWGYNTTNIELLGRIGYPLTLSVLPNLPYSEYVSRLGRDPRFEIILHLPLEPAERVRLEKNTIMVAFTRDQILQVLRTDIGGLRYLKGVSNHMGSRATENYQTMSVIFQELERDGLYFLDSFSSSRSICSGLARKTGIGFARRDIFLDNISDPQYIRGQLNRLKSRARTYGQAIGIGHDRTMTLEVLMEAMPEIAREGYKFVLVSELVK